MCEKEREEGPLGAHSLRFSVSSADQVIECHNHCESILSLQPGLACNLYSCKKGGRGNIHITCMYMYVYCTVQNVAQQQMRLGS